MLDLAAYLTRIGYEGPREPTLGVLSALHARHPATIPFENIDPLLGRPVPLDLDALQRKMIAGKRGGYCFEQNTLFKAVLEALGFTVSALAARVVWMQPPGAPPNPRSHMVLLVDLAGDRWIADVGFGGLLSTAPLRLVADLAQPTPAGTLRLQQEGMFFTLQSGREAEWQNVYRFTLEPQPAIDIEVMNWYTAAHPQSRIRNNLMMQRVTGAGRLSLLNRRLVRRSTDSTQEELLLGPPDLARALELFGLEPPATPAELFARLPQ
jgi:N-hydroxyarylamine O-acetyltransferase